MKETRVGAEYKGLQWKVCLSKTPSAQKLIDVSGLLLRNDPWRVFLRSPRGSSEDAHWFIGSGGRRAWIRETADSTTHGGCMPHAES